MVELLDPASLGGLAGLIALAGWSIGRLQGHRRPERKPAAASACAIAAQAQPGLPAQPPISAPAAVAADAVAASAPCQQRAREERRALLARAVSLAELHDEARAIRQDADILRDIAPDEELVLPAHGTARISCRYLGRSGLPTCPGALAASCKDSAACGLAVSALPEMLRHPCAELSSLTRV